MNTDPEALRDYLDDIAEFLASGRDITLALAGGRLSERAVYAALQHAVACAQSTPKPPAPPTETP